MTPFKKPLVSVIITSYNQRIFLEKAVQSVLKQTYKNIEIIIADDHSTDDTDNFVHDLQQISKLPVIYIKQEKNVGIPKNRNSAMKIIHGEYFTILDGDDLYLPRNIELMVHKLNEGFDAAYSNIEFINEDGEYIKTKYDKLMPEGHITYDIGLGLFGIMRNMLFPAKIIGKIGLMDERLPRYDGYDFTFRTSLLCRIGYIKESLAKYRVHINSDSRQLKPIDHYKDYMQIRKNIERYFADYKPLDNMKKQEVLLFWDKRLYRFWLKLPTCHEFKKKSFYHSLILGFLQGSLFVRLMRVKLELQQIFMEECGNNKYKSKMR
jgi:glycosyltransferase involved in cell wall biosynthesis